MTEDDRNTLVFPVTHIGGISWLIGAAHDRVPPDRRRGVRPAEPRARCCSRNGVTIAGSGPAFWMAYVAEQRTQPDVRGVPATCERSSAAARAKPPTLHDDVRRGARRRRSSPGYGITECPGVAHCGV